MESQRPSIPSRVACSQGAEEHSFKFRQESDYANLSGLLRGLNRFAKDSGRKFFTLNAGDPGVGFLSSKEAAILRKKGVELS